ncbi:tyrosine-type recombinase/integrase [Roseateles microcysteis]|uniref:tyrosine-type recombinase/integrase n=1 Tax=Roseateles microcysteis TaxID=3119057 RepID=UPI002FE59CFD
MARNLIPGDTTLKAIKAGDERRRMNDGAGLYLLLFVKGGSHGWRFDYSFGGKRKTLSLGTYPDTSLALARSKADEARKLVSAGIDPSSVRKEAKDQQLRERQEAERADAGLPPLDSFEAVARLWLKTIHENKVSAGHAERTRIRLEQDVFPWIGRMPIADVKAPDLLACLRRVEARGAIETAHRIKQACGQVFRFGIAEGKCGRDHAADLKDALTPVDVTHRAAITDPKRVGQLLRAIHDYEGMPTTRAALKLAPLVFVRPGELRKAEWSEIDLDAAEWKIPAERMKRSKAGKANGVPHMVPLATQAVEILRDLQPLTGHGRFVFPSPRTGERPMSDNAVLSALRRMGFPKDEMTGHGFRAMARTMLAERLHVPEAVIEAQLAHAVKDSLGRAYNRTEFLAQRRQMLQVWADHLDKLRVGAEVLPFKHA